MKPAAEKPKAATPEAKPKRQLRPGRLLSGASGLAAGFFSVAVEITRNYAYGAQKSDIYGYSYALFAVGLALIPFLAWRGWNAWLRTTWLTCMVMTAYFGVNYYAAEILERVSEARKATGQYERAVAEAETAQRNRAAAQREADAIGPTTPSAALQRLYDDAIVRKEEESKPERGGCGRSDKSRCLAAEREAAEYLRHLGRARAKEEAMQRVAVAQARLDTANVAAGIGPADAAPLATLMAMQTGGSAQDYAAGMDIGEPIAMVLGMLLFASLIHPSLSAVKEGLGFGDEAEALSKGMEVVPLVKPTVIEVAAAILSPPKPERPKRGRKPMTPEERVKKFIADELRVGEGEMTGDGMIDAFNSWSRARWPNEHPMRSRDLSPLLTKNGVERKRTGGRTRYVATPINQSAST